MSRPVYSYQFRVDTLAPGGVIVIPLDPLFTYVLRDFTGFMVSAPTSALDTYINIDGNTIIQYHCLDGCRRFFSWQGHIVVPGSEGLELASDGDPGFTNFALSGYKLSA